MTAKRSSACEKALECILQGSTAEQAAKLFGVSPCTLYRAMRNEIGDSLSLTVTERYRLAKNSPGASES